MNKIIILIFLSITTFTSHAQKRFLVGFKGGVGYRKAQVGVLGELRISSPLSLQAGVSYLSSTKTELIGVIGSRDDVYGSIIGKENAFIRTTSVIVPIQVKLNFGKKHVRPYLMAGLAPTFRLSSMGRPSDKENYDVHFENYGYYYGLSMAPAGIYNNQKSADVSSVSKSYTTNLATSFGLDINVKKTILFTELQLFSSLNKEIYFQSSFNLLLNVGVKF